MILKKLHIYFFFFCLAGFFYGCPSSQQMIPPKKNSIKKGFSTKEDTIIVTKQKIKKNTSPSVEFYKIKQNPFYSIQIGAFTKKENALKSQQYFQKIYKTIPTYIIYEKSLKLHRVLVGRFSTPELAKNLLSTLQSQHPKKYYDVWIAKIENL